MKKAIFTTILSCAFVCAAFLVACQREVVVSQTHEDLDGTSLPIVQGKFSKELTVFTTDKTTSFVVEVKSDVAGVLDHVTAGDLALVINPKSGDDVDFNDSGEGSVKPKQFVSVCIKSAKSDMNIDGYTLSFSENFQSMVRSHGMGMMIDLAIPLVMPMSNGKVAGSLSCCKKVRVTRTGTSASSISFDLHWGTSCTSAYNYACSGSCTNYTDRSVCYCGNSTRYWRWISVYGTTSSVTTYSAC